MTHKTQMALEDHTTDLGGRVRTTGWQSILRTVTLHRERKLLLRSEIRHRYKSALLEPKSTVSFCYLNVSQ